MATVQPVAASRSSIGSRIVAAGAWGIGVWTTHLFLNVLTSGLQWTLVAAFLLQIVMTAGESPLWRGRVRWFNIVILILDAITNVGGFFSYLIRLDQTDSWAAFNAGLGLNGGISPLAALVVALALGIIVAATPAFLWRQE